MRATIPFPAAQVAEPTRPEIEAAVNELWEQLFGAKRTAEAPSSAETAENGTGGIRLDFGPFGTSNPRKVNR